MARLPSNFNARDAEKMGEFTPIPAGVYTAQIVKSEMKPTKNGNGSYLQLTFQILDGDHVNRQLWLRLNLQNQNQQTVEIAEKVLATICDICNIDILTDTEELHNIPMEINVIQKEATAQYPAQNDIRGYARIEGSVAPRLNMPAAPANPAPAAGKNPPWKK